MIRLARLLGLGVAGAMVLGAAVACSSSEPVISKVFQAPPWSQDESYPYDLKDDGGKLYGTCVLETKLEVQPGQTQLNHLCGSGGPERDDRTVTVDSKTLRPITGNRTISNSSTGERTSFTTVYNDDTRTVHLTADEKGKVHEADRDLPRPTKESPEPGYYDDESLFWLMRGIPLEKGWSGSYKDVNASNGQVITATIWVDDKETVKLASGTYEAWKVRLETQSVTQFFWIDAASPHEVVKARIERLTYELSGR
ncbi:MAG: DUF3108 domain-containing protein [Dehalococcoidia bacterium]|nr:DUF3108 domain-containing protein [Dehalococcoidia bacterium]